MCQGGAIPSLDLGSANRPDDPLGTRWPTGSVRPEHLRVCAQPSRLSAHGLAHAQALLTEDVRLLRIPHLRWFGSVAVSVGRADRPAVVTDHDIAQYAQALDLDLDRVPRLQQLRRRTGVADARRCAGREQIARAQGQRVRDQRQRFPDPVNHLTGTGVLNGFAVDPCPQPCGRPSGRRPPRPEPSGRSVRIGLRSSPTTTGWSASGPCERSDR